MLRFALNLLPPLLVGLGLGWRFPGLPSRLARPLVRLGIPVSLVGLLLRSGLGANLLLAAVATALIHALALLAVCRWQPLCRALPHPSLRLGAVLGNTGYFGIPAALALLPHASLGHSITYDLVGTLITWSVGPPLLAGKAPAPGRLLAFLAGSPGVHGLIIAVVLHASPLAGLLADQLWLPARGVLLLALAVVGMRLGVMLRLPSGLRPAPGETAVLAAALSFKLLILPLLALAVAVLLGLPAPVRAAVVLQAGAPTAVSALLLAEAAGSQQERMAHLVFVSTALALLSVPLWGWLLQGLPA
ncbi:MAG: AEC family transporter [Cyanobium sp.]